MAPPPPTEEYTHEYETALVYKPIEMYSEILASGTPKRLEIPEIIIEHPQKEKWEDNEVHDFYKVPKQALKASPRILMHCSVHRDTLPKIAYVGTNTWVNADYFIWEMSARLADSGRNPDWTEFFESTHAANWKHIQKQFYGVANRPERFVKEIPIPPFHVAEVRVETDRGEQHFRLDARSGIDMIDSSFWALWKSILRRGVRFVDSVVTLRAPTITPPGESLVDPATLSPLSESSTVRSVRSALRDRDLYYPAPLRPRRPRGAQVYNDLPAHGFSGTTAAVRTAAGSAARARFPIE